VRALAAFCAAVAAYAALTAALAAAPAAAEGVEALRRAGAEHYQARRYFQAIEAFEKAVAAAAEADRPRLRSDLARALGGLGFEYLNESETRLAEETFRRALKQADDYYASFGLGYLFFLRRQDGEARTHLLACLTQRSDYAPAHKLLALVTYRKGQTKEAVERLEEAVRLDAKDRESRVLVERWKGELQILGGFRAARTEHFEVRVDPQLSDAARERVEKALEAAYRDIGEGLGSWPEESTPVVLFAEGRFHAATGTEHWVGGLYDGQLKLPVPASIVSDPEKEAELVRAVRHEYTHVFVRGAAPECPAWFHEGLAQYFEDSPAERPARRAAVYARLREGRDARIPLRKMPAYLGDIEDVELARWIYLEGLGFVEFLADRYKPFRVRLFLAALSEEHSASRAFERTYGAALEDLEKEWWDAVAAGR
jgi:tetratricopeptide (TPR) repeat protein